MTDTEYEEILRDSEVGSKRISCQMAGSKNLFIRVSPSLFKKETGCSVWFSCFITRAVVYILDPIAVLVSVIAAVLWIGIPGLIFIVPSLFLWGGCKMYFGTWLPAGWFVMLISFIIALLGPLLFQSASANVLFVCFGVIIFQNYLLYAVPLSDAIKCAWRSKKAFEIFYEVSKNTLWPVLTVLEVNEYVDKETKANVSKN